MEEQRQRQEDEARRAKEASSAEGAKTSPIKEEPNEEAMLERALAMSMEEGESSSAAQAPPVVDFANMTEDEQIAFAMQMSMQDARKYSQTYITEFSVTPIKLHIISNWINKPISQTAIARTSVP